MPTQRESLDTNFKAAACIAPTLQPTGINLHAVVCSTCGDAYFVDEKIWHAFERALDFDASDNTFTCVECESQETDEEHR